MNDDLSHKKNEAYYQAAGLPISIPSIFDLYRFKVVKKYLYGTSILDIGTYRGDFLNIIKSDYDIAGIDMNMDRVQLSNKNLGQDVVILGNIQKGLNFKDNSFDTITCMEVLEHLDEPEKALEELVRVSRKRVIITVPHNENLRYVLCIHCAKYTPYSGHLHSFNEMSIRDIIPVNTRINKVELISNKWLRYLPYFGTSVCKTPLSIATLIDMFLNRIFPKAMWMMVILDKNNDSTDSH